MAANLATEFEGFSAVPYLDLAGIWTIGYGSTHDEHAKPIAADTPPITRETALQWLTEDMEFAFQTIADEVKVALTEGQRAALADLIYNIGSGAFNGSTLLRLLNAGQYGAAADQFTAWDHVGSVELAGLLRRRDVEKAMFQSGVET
jgi:lysozyme